MAESSDEVYEVEVILNATEIDGQTLYLVKWVGYEEPTWEPVEHLNNCQEMLQEFIDRRKAECQSLPPKHRRSKGQLRSGTPTDRDQAPDSSTPATILWTFSKSNHIFVNLQGFAPELHPDTSEFDRNWYPIPEPVAVSPEFDFHIERVFKRGDEKFVRVVDGQGRTFDYEYDLVARLFPDAMKAFVEKKLIALRDAALG
jgi:hypothetical protein